MSFSGMLKIFQDKPKKIGNSKENCEQKKFRFKWNVRKIQRNFQKKNENLWKF